MFHKVRFIAMQPSVGSPRRSSINLLVGCAAVRHTMPFHEFVEMDGKSLLFTAQNTGAPPRGGK